MGEVFDVLVVGGGPAGSLTAYHLARAGCRVAIVDSREFPRDKACGGGIQLRTAQQIPFDWSPVVRSSVRRVRFSYRMGLQFERVHTEPIVHCVLRSEFDDFLLRKAREAGARVFERVRVNSVTANGTFAVAHTPAGDFRARYLVGADGANSIAGRELNQRSSFFWQAAVYAEFASDGWFESGLAADAIHIDWGTLPAGYAWIFPKGEYVNVGAGCPHGLARVLKHYLAAFLRQGSASGADRLAAMRFTGHQLPTLTGNTCLARGSLFLVGDAAGLVEPLTGEGISYACQSAGLAAASIVEQFDRADAAPAYRSAVRREIEPEIVWARRVLTFATCFPRLFVKVFRHSDVVWQTFCGVLRGEKTFQLLQGQVAGPLSHLAHCLEGPMRFSERIRLGLCDPVALERMLEAVGREQGV